MNPAVPGCAVPGSPVPRAQQPATFRGHAEMLYSGAMTQQQVSDNVVAIECEKCLDWFHPECVGIQAYDDSTTRKFTCPNCKYP